MKKILIILSVIALALGGYYGIKKIQQHRSGSTASAKIIRYRSTMNANEISDKPGKDSMGMDMVPFEESSPDDIETPEGLAPVTISADKRTMIGLTLETASPKIIFREITTPVKIVQDETRQFRVNTKVGGWVENLYVNQTGQYVKKGAPLLSIYSP